jgi:phage tail sheath gpL-like
MAISDALSSELISKVSGFKVTKGNNQNTTPNLPQRIVIIGQANTSNDPTVTHDTETVILNPQAAANNFGAGSPIHSVARILLPFVGGIPVVAYCQGEPAGATAKRLEIEVTGIATENATHYLVVNGRKLIDGQAYSFTVNVGDNAGDIHQKIEDAITAVASSPFTATSDDYSTVATSKVKGLVANEMSITVDTDGVDAGLTYSVSSTQSGAGTPSISDTIDALDNEVWNTIIVNTYGTNTTICDALQTFNGIPSVTNPTGRYSAIIAKPFFALTGTCLENGATSFTDTRKTQTTIVMCPTPLSVGMHYEGAANYAALLSVQAQNNPHLDISGQLLPDMPAPANIGFMNKFVNRNFVLGKGHSTAKLNGTQYEVVDFVTTYNAVGENPPAYRYVRSLVIDFNVNFTYHIKEHLYVIDKVIARDSDIISATNVIKPSSWKQILISMTNDLVNRGLLTDSEFTIASIQVGISATNPDRFETFLKMKRSSYSRQQATTVEIGFNNN